MMLRLDQTALLLDGLRPPSGMEIDAAIGTTFTLDLAALLAVPVAATFSSEEQADDGASLLETVRRYADRTVLFCQAGAIGVPSKYRAAMTFVEKTVVEIKKPKGGIFHPKVWVVRFADRNSYLHRVLVLSRNLTFDRSWDVIVRLDEEPDADRIVATQGIVDFLQFLSAPANAARPLDADQSALVEDVTSTLVEARLAVPEPFEAGSFVPLLSRRDGQPFNPSCNKALAISPFLTSGAVKEFVATAAQTSLISRPGALDSYASGLTEKVRLLRLKDAVLHAEQTIDDTFDVESDTDIDSTVGDLRGLHAKTYIQDLGNTATCWLGSANLTTGAFNTNVELLVELHGPVSQVGVDATLSPTPEKRNLSWFVEEHTPAETPAEPEAEDGVSELEARVFDLASREVVLALEPNGDHWDARLSIDPWPELEDVRARARPLTLSESDALELDGGSGIWLALPLGSITPFIILEVSGGGASRRTLVRARLVGDPADRRRSVIANAIASRDDFFRYLAALLGIDLGLGFGGTGGDVFSGGWTGSRSGAATRVLEDLLVTASREPKRLASLDETVRQLRAREDVADIVPEEFHAVWDAVHAARRDEI